MDEFLLIAAVVVFIVIVVWHLANRAWTAALLAVGLTCFAGHFLVPLL